MATNSNYDNGNTQQDKNKKMLLGIWSPSDKGHMVFSSQKYGGKNISFLVNFRSKSHNLS